MNARMVHSTTHKLFVQKLNNPLTELLDELGEDAQTMMLYAECYPEVWGELAEKGYKALELSQDRVAIRIFGFLLLFFPYEAAYHAAYADALCMARRYLEAAYHYYETTQLAPEIPDAFYYLSELYMIFRHPTHAVDALEAADSLADHDHYLQETLPQRLDCARAASQSPDTFDIA
ncbi:MAG: hypothetical protein CL920_10775 [Deltaproteobacteria bacterium]|nr:hypothetical protein [Deltaproteobacteria bacterium]MBU49170.1 hypothetical protein [Deltaproteobacteria bacterium]|tara:strand:- start:3227 stop:3754 length:528 start_codon:yes stop_codon:yes gene_type:complete